MDNKLLELEARLKAHDWAYSYSDDHKAYIKGRDNAAKIKALREETGEAGQKLYDQYNPWSNLK